MQNRLEARDEDKHAVFAFPMENQFSYSIYQSTTQMHLDAKQAFYAIMQILGIYYSDIDTLNDPSRDTRLKLSRRDYIFKFCHFRKAILLGCANWRLPV